MTFNHFYRGCHNHIGLTLAYLSTYHVPTITKYCKMIMLVACDNFVKEFYGDDDDDDDDDTGI